MAQIEQLLKEKDLKLVENTKSKARKPSISSELINNLLYRLKRRGNLIVEYNERNNWFVERVRIAMPSNFFNKEEKNLFIWAKPVPTPAKNGKTYLMLHIESPAILKGYRLRASDIFGSGINSVRLN